MPSLMLAVALLLGAWCNLIHAEDRRPPADEIINRLTGTPESQEFRSRGTSDMRSKGVAVEGTRVQPTPQGEQPVRSIDLEINFEYDSARLSSDSIGVLENLGKALSHPSLAGARFMIGGHTDGAGSDAYNLNLSRRRAQAVANYLKATHGIPSRQLVVRGFGKTRLLDTANPLNPVNRRVQVANLGSAE